MQLSRDDADLFYRLMWQLQSFVNKRLAILPRIAATEACGRLPDVDKLKVRDALYAHPELIDEFAQANPGGLSPEELAIVREWKHVVAGTFFIERFLKKGAIFVAEHEPPNVYLVLALYDSLEEILPPFGAPFYVEAALLPFRGQIIYDGLLQPYAMIFGPGVRGSLREDYLRAKERGEIITSLGADGTPAVAPRRPAKASPDLQPVLDNVAAMADGMKAAERPIQDAALAVLRASAHLARAAVRSPEDLAALWEHEAKTQRALTRLGKSLERAG